MSAGDRLLLTDHTSPTTLKYLSPNGIGVYLARPESGAEVSTAPTVEPVSGIIEGRTLSEVVSIAGGTTSFDAYATITANPTHGETSLGIQFSTAGSFDGTRSILDGFGLAGTSLTIFSDVHTYVSLTTFGQIVADDSTFVAYRGGGGFPTETQTVVFDALSGIDAGFQLQSYLRVGLGEPGSWSLRNDASFSAQWNLLPFSPHLGLFAPQTGELVAVDGAISDYVAT